MRENRGEVFDRLPATDAEREVAGRPSREAVVDWWVERFGVEPATFEGHTFWEKGAGSVWAFAADVEAPVAAESLGMRVLRTRQEHWKPTTDGVQRFCRDATRNVVALTPGEAARFVAGETVEPDWDGDWGYLVAAHELAGGLEPIGVGLYTYGTLESMVPKGRRRDLQQPDGGADGDADE